MVFDMNSHGNAMCFCCFFSGGVKSLLEVPNLKELNLSDMGRMSEMTIWGSGIFGCVLFLGKYCGCGGYFGVFSIDEVSLCIVCGSCGVK